MTPNVPEDALRVLFENSPDAVWLLDVPPSRLWEQTLPRSMASANRPQRSMSLKSLGSLESRRAALQHPVLWKFWEQLGTRRERLANASSCLIALAIVTEQINDIRQRMRLVFVIAAFVATFCAKGQQGPPGSAEQTISDVPPETAARPASKVPS